jgi:hypothetical protein
VSKQIEDEIVLRKWLENWAGKEFNCATREQFEDLLYIVTEAAEQEGFDAALLDGDVEDALKDALLARYYYLKHGGEWQRELLPAADTYEVDAYLAGFLDAMNLLGVKP